MKLPRPTSSSVIATVALFLALGGSSYAAIQISGSSIRNGTVTGKDLKNGSVKSADVGNGSLLAKDFRSGQLPAGEAGPAGPQGPQGEPGPQGPAGPTSVVVRRIDVLVPGIPPPLAAVEPDPVSAVAKCKPGERAVGGGAAVTAAGRGGGDAFASEPAFGNRPAQDGETPTGWLAATINFSSVDVEMRVHAVCVAP